MILPSPCRGRTVRAIGVAVCLSAAALASPTTTSAQNVRPWPVPTPALLTEGSAPRVQSVEIQGNATIPEATLRYYISTKPGDRFDALRLRRDYRRLWETGLLDDLRLDVRDGERGKIVTFVVRERPLVASVDFRGSKVLSKTTIESKLKAKHAEIKLDAYLDPARVLQVEALLRDLLAEAGRPSATVKHETKPVGAGRVGLAFVIDDGPEVRIGRVLFQGNRELSSDELRGHMKALRHGKAYSEDGWLEDQQRLEDFYRTRGYVTATVGTPKVSQYDGTCGTFKKRPCRMIQLEIPVSEDGRYKLASLKIDGLTLFPEDSVRQLIDLKPGELYNWSRLNKAYATLREWYGAKGYINWTPETLTDPHPEQHTVDVTIKMNEDKQYYVGRITFLHNETTRDKVARREISLNEGDVLNTEALRSSIRRLNQLGYFKPLTSGPEITPSVWGDDMLDLTFTLEEQRRAQFTAGGGVSGYEGTFINSSFSTPNLGGTGNSLKLTAQGGKRVRDYEVALTNPYFLDRPMTAGIDLYHRRVIPALGSTTTAGYADTRTGGGFTVGHPLGKFTQLYAAYLYEVAKVENVDANGDPLTTPATGGSVDQSLRDLYGDPGQWHDSRVTLTFLHDTVNDQFTPHYGWRVSTSLRLSGGPLGGTLSALRPSVEAALFLPTSRRTGFGFHAETAWVHPFGNTAQVQPLGPGETIPHDGLPFVERFAVGGENQVRGYPFFSIFPGTAADGRVLRGDYYLVVNGEHYWDVYGPARFVAFFDAGAAFRKSQAVNFNQFRISTGVELRILVPFLNLPVRFIYAFNPNRDATEIAAPWNVKASTFKFAIGPAF